MTVIDLREASAGEGPETRRLRQEFDLPAEDVEALNVLGLPWETVVEGSVQWLFIHDWSLPTGFTVATATLGLRIVPGYPSAALDMVYVHPPLARAAGGGIAALSETVIDGRTFQQWSRHYSPQNPWRPDLDSIATHLRLIDTWFVKAVA